MKREKHPRRFPVALTIAGSDSGGGAGIQADLKTFAALGVHGATVLSCITAQNPRSVLAVEPCSTRMVRSQLQAVFAELPPAALKTGMLYSEPIIELIAEFLHNRPCPVVVDPVMISTSGTHLLRRGAVKSVRERLLPLASLITPNVHEAEALLKTRLSSVEDLRRAAKELHSMFGTAILVKGGHLKGLREAVDIFYDGSEELLLSAAFARGIKTHGTGCTYSAAITAFLAKGTSLPVSVRRAKEFITKAIRRSRVAAGHHVLNTSR